MRIKHNDNGTDYVLHFFQLAPRDSNAVKYNHPDDSTNRKSKKLDWIGTESDTDSIVFIPTAEGYDEREKDSYYAEKFDKREIYAIDDEVAMPGGEEKKEGEAGRRGCQRVAG